jgi:Fe-S-cluster containining protein
MEGRCIKCGDCCEFIAVGFTLDEVRKNENFPDRDFILNHWLEVNPPKIKPNPLMSDKCFNGYIFYKCDLFDPILRRCNDHENRPNICRDYPGQNRKPESLFSARCGFMPQEIKI